MNHEALTELLRGPTGEGVRYARGSWNPRDGLDCRSCAYLALRDVFGLAVERADFEVPPASNREELEAALASRAGRWRKLGETAEAACEPGDVIVSAPAPEDGLAHLSVVISSTPHRAITCTRPDGVSMPRVFLIQSVFAAYRFAGGPA